MFGFSLTKILFTVAVVIAVWYGFKWVGRMKEVRKRDAKDRLRRQAGNPGSNGGGSGGGESGGAEEMVECPTCGAFVAATGAKNCGKEGCPYPG